jgi:hypothetical protein
VRAGGLTRLFGSVRGKAVLVMLIAGLVEILLLGYTGMSIYMMGFGPKASKGGLLSSDVDSGEDLRRIEEILSRKRIPYYQAFGRDPMVPLAMPRPPQGESEKEAPKEVRRPPEVRPRVQEEQVEIKVTCVIVGGGAPYAILSVGGENRIVSQGEMVGGERVVRIDERGVVLRKGSSERRIEIVEMMR